MKKSKKLIIIILPILALLIIFFMYTLIMGKIMGISCVEVIECIEKGAKPCISSKECRTIDLSAPEYSNYSEGNKGLLELSNFCMRSSDNDINGFCWSSIPKGVNIMGCYMQIDGPGRVCAD
jgi:hypothetical protein